MVITCPRCINGVVDGITCSYCGGDTEIDLLDTMFRDLAESDFRALTGQVWSEILDKLDAIIAEQALLREDLTTILTRIWNKVNE